MCTMVAKKFPDIPAIPCDKQAHNISGINLNKVTEFLSSDINISLITKKSFASYMPNWMTKHFFDPESERVCLTTHQYVKSKDAQKFRKMDNLQLIDFVELPLKNKAQFISALKIICTLEIKEYLKDYYVPLPGDHPIQFYVRNIVNNTLNHLWQPTSANQNEDNQRSSSSTLEETEIGSQSQPMAETMEEQNDADHDMFSQLVTSLISSIGALHVSLNG